MAENHRPINDQEIISTLAKALAERSPEEELEEKADASTDACIDRCMVLIRKWKAARALEQGRTKRGIFQEFVETVKPLLKARTLDDVQITSILANFGGKASVPQPAFRRLKELTTADLEDAKLDAELLAIWKELNASKEEKE